jgi:hypothetical protein
VITDLVITLVSITTIVLITVTIVITGLITDFQIKEIFENHALYVDKITKQQIVKISGMILEMC